MKYETEVTIHLPRERVVTLLDDPNNLSKWQPALRSVEHIEGEVAQPGSKTRLVYDMRGREVVMIETIVSHNLPDEMSFTFEADGVHNMVQNTFYAEGERTRWVMGNQFQFSGFMRVMSLFMGGAFRKQTREDMERFKEFAEAADM
ncbi:MAG: SRPBCC family protein [Chloroflexota bacterium]